MRSVASAAYKACPTPAPLRSRAPSPTSGSAGPDTPAAAVEWGTYPRQRVVQGTVRTLPALAAYPEMTVTIVVPFAQGGLTDVPVRLFASVLQEKLGVSVVVENKSGASGTIAGLSGGGRAGLPELRAEPPAPWNAADPADSAGSPVSPLPAQRLHQRRDLRRQLAREVFGREFVSYR
mgnify:CR=1 FL=1